MEKQNWDIGVTLGYYGRDRNRCFRTVFCEILENEIQNALSVDGLKKRIEYLLTLEYGSV
jgi:hypothetical protein